MKKFFAAALALTMTAAMFTACGDADSSSSSKADSTAASSAAEASSTESTAASEGESSAADDASSGAEEAAAEFVWEQMPGYDASATETVIEVTDPSTDDWANGLGGNDFIDARTFTKDKDLHVAVDFELKPDVLDTLEQGIFDTNKWQIVIGPAHAYKWTKFIDSTNPDGLVVEYPSINTLPADSEWVVDGENLRDKDGNMAPIFIKADGYFKFGDYKQNHIEFTIPAATVNEMIDRAYAEVNDDGEEGSWDGIIFQNAGGVVMKKVTLDHGNVYLNSAILEAFPEPEE